MFEWNTTETLFMTHELTAETASYPGSLVGAGHMNPQILEIKQNVT